MRTLFLVWIFTIFPILFLYPQEVRWADTVIKCTSQKNNKQFGCRQLLGSPNSMPHGGNNPCAWAPKTRNDMAVIKVGYKGGFKARQVIIAENSYPGCIYRVYTHSNSGKSLIYQNKADTITSGKRMFHLPVNQSTEKIHFIEIHFMGSFRKGWPQIDAIGLKKTEGTFSQPIHQMENPSNYGEPKSIENSINSIYNEVHPLISPDGSRLYFVRTNHPENTGGKDAGDDIWYAKRKADGTWSEPRQIGEPLSNDGSNAVYSILPGMNTLLCKDIYSEKPPRKKSVAISERKAFGWGKPQGQNIKDYFNRNNQASFYLANDGRTMIMALERYKGEGGLDLYVSFKTGENSWSKPQHLGSKINTAANEVTPFLASDNKTLYFSTKGFPSHGNNDIFVTQRKGGSWQNWTKPVNLGPPVNTSEWNAYFTLPASGQFGYYVSYENSGNMGDLYRIRIPQNIKPQPVLMVQGQILNAKTGKPMKAEVVQEHLLDDKPFAVGKSAPEKGEYTMIMPKGKKYSLLANSKNYMARAETIDATGLDSFEKKIRNIYMVPIEVGQTIRLNNIFFEFNKATLKETSYPELNRVAKLMEDHPKMVIEVAGHTDSVGSNSYNRKLSKDRAESVKDYLVNQKGIAEERIKTKGYGETKPIASNSTEKGRQENRRVNFTILKMEE